MLSQIGKKLLFFNLSYRTTESNLFVYFTRYGLIEEIQLDRDDQDQSLRQGFVIYQEIHSINEVMLHRPHFIDGRSIHLQRAIPKEFRMNSMNLSEQLGMNLVVNEIFISRVSSEDKPEIFREYFQSFGNILHCRVVHSRQTGYAFIRFTDYDSVDQIILSRPHRINFQWYPIRKCIPREYHYIMSSIKPISPQKLNWQTYSLGLINMKTFEIIDPFLTNPHRKATSHIKQFPTPNESIKSSSSHEFDIITNKSFSSSSISIIHSTPQTSPNTNLNHELIEP